MVVGRRRRREGGVRVGSKESCKLSVFGPDADQNNRGNSTGIREFLPRSESR